MFDHAVSVNAKSFVILMTLPLASCLLPAAMLGVALGVPSGSGGPLDRGLAYTILAFNGIYFFAAARRVFAVQRATFVVRRINCRRH